MKLMVGFFLVIAALATVSDALSYESTLIRDLLMKYESSYSKYARPVANHSEAVNVSLGLSLIHITDLDVKRGLMQSNVWFKISWNDTNLRWDPKEYKGVKHVHLPIDKIWKPDFLVFNKGYGAGFGENFVDTKNVLALVYNTGSVLWIPQANIISLLKKGTKIEKGKPIFAPITVGSWTYNGYQMNISHFFDEKKVELDFYHENPAYTIVGNEAVRHVKYYACCKEPYYHMDFNLKILLKDDDNSNDSGEAAKPDTYTPVQSESIDLEANDDGDD